MSIFPPVWLRERRAAQYSSLVLLFGYLSLDSCTGDVDLVLAPLQHSVEYGAYEGDIAGALAGHDIAELVVNPLWAWPPLGMVFVELKIEFAIVTLAP